jgi:hypothetical protein
MTANVKPLSPAINVAMPPLVQTGLGKTRRSEDP